MRTKTRNTFDIKPGMVIRLDFSTQPFKQVATVKRGPWAYTRQITFTDGTSQWHGRSSDFHVVRAKTARNAVKARASLIPQHALANVLDLLGAYARTAVA